MQISEMKTGDRVEGFYLLQNAASKQTAAGKSFLSAVLADRTDSIDAIVWDYTGPVSQKDVGAVVKVQGTASEFRGTAQVTIDRIWLATEADHYDLKDLVPTAPIDVDAAYQKIEQIVGTISDSDYAAICREMLRRYGDQFRTIPAAKSVHHSFLNGLLMHTLSMLQAADWGNKMFPHLPEVPIPIVILAVIVVGGIVGLVNGFFVAKFHLHPFIVTLATQLIVYGVILMFYMANGNNGQPLSGLSQTFTNFVTGPLFRIKTGASSVAVPKYVLYAAILVAIMWFIWNKTKFGKNMFAVGSNIEAANVSGVSVFKTTVLVHTLAGCMYGITGFIESARIASNTANTGLNYESDAIAACVIGGVSFVGGTGKISGIVLGVFLLRIIFVALNFLSISGNMQYVIKGLIILVACSIDMRKYLVRK